ncbi:biotin--[acetyl-CoA-carboxylase] ligase [Parachitinimonas caeni]|uniref:Bifunctional ligase/repressor BirA n=1 Tax=Parachitinimonas caeni TaxID=3031301 RepID=A0ABT7DT41_9NEIS|nr:biotin--[acetyl-CoA-carboxylase] ligase [Parachitinimonas caeni]MDK2123241.1 biotin--[acetyl-CoA-carboxylase] ligase [Parachitinimonas caeni]
MNCFDVLRQLSAEHFISGEALASQLGVSRSLIWQALQQAEHYGIEVHSIRGRGYRLSRPLIWLDEATIARHLGSQARFFDLKLFDSTGSTNTELLAAAGKGAPSGMVYAAEWQTAGRGRRGRQWRGELGASLMFSLLWRFDCGAAQLSGLSLAVGIALARAVERHGATQARLKWPNDLIAGTQKLAGILIEVQGDALGPNAAVIGIGLNINLSQQARTALDQPITDMQAQGGETNRNVLLAGILAELADILPAFESGGFKPLVAEWERRHAWHHQPVTILHSNGEQSEGVALGITDDGALRVSGAQGEFRLFAGDVSLRRKDSN